MTGFHDLYESYSQDVYRFALYLSGDPAVADDITSETFVRVWSSPEPIRLATVKGYLLTIARNLWLMERSNWAQKAGQEHILAVRITRAGWEEALSLGVLAAPAWAHVQVEADPGSPGASDATMKIMAAGESGRLCKPSMLPDVSVARPKRKPP